MDYLIIVDLKNPIPCQESALDTEYSIKVDSIPATMILPGLEKNSGQEASIRRDYSLKLKNDWVSNLSINNDITWGFILRYPTFLVNVDKVLFKVNLENKTNNEIEEFLHKLECWVLRLSSILDIKNKLILFYTTGSQLFDIRFELLQNKGKWEKVHIDNKASITAVIKNEDEFFKKEDLVKVLDLASNTTEIRTEYLLFLESLNAFKINEYRRSIVESACSIEMVLTTVIIEKLTKDGKSKSEISKILKNHRMLSLRLALCKSEKINLPPIDFTNEVVNLRNNVVHEGKKPTEEEARKIIAHNKTVLESLLPL